MSQISGTGLYAWTTETQQMAEDYCREFAVPMDEAREWYRNAEDKPGLLAYWRRALQIEGEWRAKVAADMRARQAVTIPAA